MNESLISYQQALPEASEESIVRQFRDWEKRGRGWQVYDFPVEIEPPFRPFSFFMPEERPVIDDGKTPSFLNRLLDSGSKISNESFESKELARYQRYCEYIEETDEPAYCSYYLYGFFEIRVLLPKDFKSSASAVRQMLLSLAYLSCPVAFEIIGNSEQIAIQFAATGRDLEQVKQQLETHLPGCSLEISDDAGNGFLSTNWINAGESPVIVDFGLSKGFALPLQTVQNFETDPLATVIGAMANLETTETAVFQILFQKCQNDWASEFIDTIQCFDDTSFFDYLPDIKRQAGHKFSSLLYASVVRVAAKTDYRDRSMQIVRNIAGALTRLADPSGNELIPLASDEYDIDHHKQALLDRQSFRCGMLLNTDELISLVHIPSSTIASSKLIRDKEAQTKSIPVIAKGHSFTLGQNIHNGKTEQASLSAEQRTRHLHIIGSSGSGKSTLLLSLIKQDIENGEGLCVIDPHGDLIDDVIANVPESRLNDIILFDPSDSEYPIGFNILQANSELEKTMLSSDLVAAFRRMSTSWGDVMDSVLANAILAIVESTKGGTLLDLKRFLIEKSFREEFLKTVPDEAVRYFWRDEFPQIAGKPQSSILIRLDAFLRPKLVRNIVCQKNTKLDLREIMDNKKILLIKLSQGLIGEENSYLLGTMLVSKIYQTALTRQDTQKRPYFWLYLDEFQHFITPSMESILSGSRKYNLGLTISHQEFRQLQSRNQEVASSVLSNCYTRICFRLGDADAEKFASGFSFFDGKALQNLGIGQAIARIERSDHDFNLSVSPAPKVESKLADQKKSRIYESTRSKYAMAREAVERNLFQDYPVDENTSTEPVHVDKPLIESGPDSPKTEKTESPVDRVKEQNPPLEVDKDVSDPLIDTSAQTKTQSEHRYLQSLIKRIGENYGFVSTIEKEVFGGIGRVDIVLEKEFLKIACEIANTNTIDYEIQNIQKCLAAGFNKVVVISNNKRHLGNIRRLIEATISANLLTQVHFLEPEHFHLFLEKLNSEAYLNLESEKVKGYSVNVSFTELGKPGVQAQTRVIEDILKNAEDRQKQ